MYANHDLIDILTTPQVPLAMANMDRILSSSKKMLATFLQAPMTNYQCLSKAVDAIRPLAFQVLLFGYVAVFQLPIAMVRSIGVRGNYSFLIGAHKVSYGKDRSAYQPQHALAMTMGPGEAECQTIVENATPERYGETVLYRARHTGAFFVNFASYYRDGLAFDKWEKSTSTLRAFHNIDENNASSLKAPATIIWGQKDEACNESICLDGFGDYLSKDSQVLKLPSTGHWTPIDKESRETLKAILERLVQTGNLDKENLLDIVKETYPSAYVSIDR